MAERRMFAKTIIDSDCFLDMPLSAQALYFHLSMRADDDGFVNNPKKIQRMIGASDDDCRLLIIKRFILTFDSGVIVIKHWKIHNFIRNDRYKETVYLSEKSTLSVDKNNEYTEIGTNDNTLGIPTVSKRLTLGIPTVSKRDTQVRLGKDSKELDKVSKEKETVKEKEIACDCDVSSQEIETGYECDEGVRSNGHGMPLTENPKVVKNTKEKSLDEVIAAQKEKLQEPLREFVKMRKSIKKPITTHGLELVISKLRKLSGGHISVAEEIINQSIMNGWQGVFALKEEPVTPTKKKSDGSEYANLV